MKKRRIHPGRLAAEVLSVLAGIIMLVPVYIVLVNAFKPYKEILTRTFSLPQSFFIDNLTYVWMIMWRPPEWTPVCSSPLRWTAAPTMESSTACPT